MASGSFGAKKTLAEAHVPFETPRGDELGRRIESVLTVIYLIFNEGYTATSGEEWMRAALSEDALRLGRMLAQLLPDESEVHALLSLMELQASRNAVRRGGNGEAVLLPDQDRLLWDTVQILARNDLARTGAKNWEAVRNPMHCKQRLLHVTCALAQPKRQIGTESFFYTTLSCKSGCLRSWH